MFKQDDSVGVIVRGFVRRVPRGRAATYGTIARAAVMNGRPIGGARTVSWILASLKAGDDTPWHRVVGAGGVILLPDRRGALQTSRLKREGVRFKKGVIEPGHLIAEGAKLTQSDLVGGADCTVCMNWLAEGVDPQAEIPNQ